MLAYFSHRVMLNGMNEIIDRETRPTAEIAQSLLGLLRHHADVAYVVGVKKPRTVRNWLEGGVEPADPHMRQRLEVAEKLAKIVAPGERPHVPAAWLTSHNPYVGDRQPSAMIQSLNGTESDTETVEQLVQAAESFAGTRISG